jgi:hypothetical protein
MQELEQRAVWDGKIFLDGEFRTPDGGGELAVLDKARRPGWALPASRRSPTWTPP